MNNMSNDQALQNAVASAEMEGLHPTDADIKLITEFINDRLSREELVRSVLSDIKRS